jgi:TonB family protein
MRLQTLLVRLFFSVALPGIVVYGQNAGRDSSSAPTRSSSRIQTGVVLDSIKYYIRMAPVDTTRDDPMPMYKPDNVVPVQGQPVPIKEVPAQYPAEARRLKIEGTVWIKCLVGTDGKATKPSVMRSDAAVLDNAALSAVVQWRFSPARLNDTPVAVWAAIPFRFRLGTR